MASEGSTRAVITAMFANLGIAVTKFIAAALTGSSSMLAEGVHSLADTSNQALLLLGGKRAKRAATPEHPFGYGRDEHQLAIERALLGAANVTVTRPSPPNESRRPLTPRSNESARLSARKTPLDRGNPHSSARQAPASSAMPAVV